MSGVLIAALRPKIGCGQGLYGRVFLRRSQSAYQKLRQQKVRRKDGKWGRCLICHQTMTTSQVK